MPTKGNRVNAIGVECPHCGHVYDKEFSGFKLAGGQGHIDQLFRQGNARYRLRTDPHV